MKIQDDLLYTREHEWVRVEGSKGAIGITDYAQNHFGDVTYVELPEKGKSVQQFEALASIDSVKASSDIYAPMAGTVSEVNESLETAPENVNNDPYGAGWIAKIDINDADGIKNLMDAKAYKAYLESIKE